MSCYWEQPRPGALRHDPSRPYAEQYRIDARQFAHLFQLVSPWTCGAHTEILAERTFRLLDDNMDQLMEFKAFVSCLGMAPWVPTEGTGAVLWTDGCGSRQTHMPVRRVQDWPLVTLVFRPLCKLLSGPPLCSRWGWGVGPRSPWHTQAWRWLLSNLCSQN